MAHSPITVSARSTAGVQMRIEGSTLVDARIAVKPIDPAQRYRLALTNFTATGGDGYPKLITQRGLYAALRQLAPP